MVYQLEWKADEGRDWLAAPLAVGNVYAADGTDVFGDEELYWLQVLVRVWHEHYARNILRGTYYDGKEVLRNIAGSTLNPASTLLSARLLTALRGQSTGHSACLLMDSGIDPAMLRRTSFPS